MHLDNNDLSFLARLSVAPEGRLLLKFLEERLKDRDSKLRAAVGEEVHRAQGRALEVSELIGDITQAHTVLNRSGPSRTSSSRIAA